MGRKNLATPQHIFDEINAECAFDIDACAEDWSAKLPNYCSLPNRNAFEEDFTGKRVWCNPPFDKNIPLFLKKIVPEAALAVFLLPTSSAKWFHELVLPRAFRLDFFKGRICFDYPPGVDNPRRPDTDTFLSIFDKSDPDWYPVQMRSRCAKTGKLL